MSAICRLLLIATIAAAATQAFAEPRHGGRYEMRPLPPGPDRSVHKMLILDKQTGALWTWSEPATVEYAGKLFPVTAAGPFARIIHVDPAKDRR